MKKGVLSKFVEEAVRWRLADRTIAEVRCKFTDLPAEMQAATLEKGVAPEC